MMVCPAHFSVFTVQCLSFIGVQIQELCIHEHSLCILIIPVKAIIAISPWGKKSLSHVDGDDGHRPQFPKINASDDSKPR